MRKLLFLLAMMATATVAAQPVYKYWVAFRDKGQSPYSLERPSEFLGPRALERRARLQVPLDSLDLPVSPGYVATLEREGLTVMHCSKWLNGVVAYSRSELPQGWRSPSFVQSVTLCEVSPLAKPDSCVPNHGSPLPRFEYDTLFGPDYYGGAFCQIDQLNGLALHRCGYQGNGVLVGVCDCGFPGVDTASLFAHLVSEDRIVATRDFVWPVENDVYTTHSHGTHALSTMAAFAPGTYVGTAPKASYALCRTENVFGETLLEEYNWVAAAEWLDSLGADIISTSLGYFDFTDSLQNHTLTDLDGHTAPISRGANVAVTRGMVVVVSAGNDGLADPQHLNVPADAERVLTVGAVDSVGMRVGFSSYGPTSAGLTKPDVMAMGHRVLSASPDGLFRYTSGTSLSCPVMAGMMACLRQRFPNLLPGQLCDSVRAWGNRADSVDSYCGYGIPDFGRALCSPLATLPVEDRGASFNLFPNPSRGSAMVELPAPGRVEVTDMQGRRVAVIEKAYTRVSLPTLQRGVYMVRVTMAGQTGSLRWVVAR